MHNACIRNVEPSCPYTAVIPSVTVDDISNIKDLADCFVHVVNINTTFYIDDKHRIMTIWAGPLYIDNYDYVNNPLNIRAQTVHDFARNRMYIYNKLGESVIVNYGE